MQGVDIGIVSSISLNGGSCVPYSLLRVVDRQGLL